MSGFIHPDRRKQHARQDARQRFLDRQQGVERSGDGQKGEEDKAQRQKWKTEGDTRRASKWEQRTSGSGGWKKDEPREQQGGTTGDSKGGDSGAFVHPDRQQQVKAQLDERVDGSGGWQRNSNSGSRDQSSSSSSIPQSQPRERQWRRPPPSSPHTTDHSGEVPKDAVKKEVSHASSHAAPPQPSSSPSPSSPPPEDDPTAIDREWYDQDEENPVASDDVAHAFPAVDAADSSTRRQARKLTARAQQVTRDNNAWEENRMFQSGVVTATTVDTDFTSAETEKKVQLVVHELKPPFLDGRTVYTKQESMVSVVKDSTSDMAMIARKGSALLASMREKSDRNKMKDKFWEVAGNRIGNVMGVKQQESEEERKEREKEEGEQQKEREAGGVDYRQASQFASHLQDKTAAQSEFSASNSVAAQRQYLPIYTCKDELMRVIRDNPVVVIVGETGSGKCFARGTRLRLFNGDTIAAERVVGNETLMGDDGLPRIVTSGTLTRGASALFCIAPTWNGAKPFTVNGAHILVLVNNTKPLVRKRSNGGREVWEVRQWVLTTDNRMREQSRLFRTEALAQAKLEAIIAAGWEQLEWEPTVEEFLDAPVEARHVCKLVACKAITFTNPLLPSLHQVLTLVLGVAPSPAQHQYMAWWLGVWLTNVCSDRASISQCGSPQPDSPYYPRLFTTLKGDYERLFKEKVDRHVGRTSPQGWHAVVFSYETGSVADLVLCAYGLINNKHIPRALICESLDVRRRLLAGIIDGAGHYSMEREYKILAKHRCILDGCKELAATLGLRNSAITVHANTINPQTGEPCAGYRLLVSGDMWDVVQYCVTSYKQCFPTGDSGYAEKNKESRCYSFTITELPAGEYFGFAVHGGINRRFLLEDYTVTHNVSTSLCSRHSANSTAHPLRAGSD